MESGWRNLFNSNNGEGQKRNFTSDNAWEASVAHAPLPSERGSIQRRLDAGSGSGRRSNPEPNVTCLELGKRRYCEELGDRHVAGVRLLQSCPCHASDGGGGGAGTTVPPAAGATVRCRVEGCHVALGDLKEYYRRHKVCEVHSKAPVVVVLGLYQRFCQQCSRFHGVKEFDEAKRSCRRRLAGHNQRRRKGTHNSLSRNSTPENNVIMTGQFQSLLPLPPTPPPLKTGRVPSLLSSPETKPCVPSDDLSSRCSVALSELIAENRATSIFRPYWNQNCSPHAIANTFRMSHDLQMWDRFNECESHDYET